MIAQDLIVVAAALSAAGLGVTLARVRAGRQARATAQRASWARIAEARMLRAHVADRARRQIAREQGRWRKASAELRAMRAEAEASEGL